MLQGFEVFMAGQLFDVQNVGPAVVQFGRTAAGLGVRGDRDGPPEGIGLLAKRLNKVWCSMHRHRCRKTKPDAL